MDEMPTHEDHHFYPASYFLARVREVALAHPGYTNPRLHDSVEGCSYVNRSEYREDGTVRRCLMGQTLHEKFGISDRVLDVFNRGGGVTINAVLLELGLVADPWSTSFGVVRDVQATADQNRPAWGTLLTTIDTVATRVAEVEAASP